MNTKDFPELPDLGGRLRAERKKRQFSLDTLAELSGVSKAMLSQIEASKVNPTIATMWKIAHALKIDFQTLLTGKNVNAKKFELKHRDELSLLQMEKTGAAFRVLSSIDMANDLELYELILPPGGHHNSQPHAAGTEEYIYMLDGLAEVTAGSHTGVLHAGDSLVFDSDVEHSFVNLSQTEPARCHMVVRFSSR